MVIMTPQEVEQYVLLASDATNLQHQQQANALLHQWISSTDDVTLADTLLQVLRSTQRELVLFYTLTAFLRLHKTTPEQRVALRQELFSQLLLNNTSGCWSPSYLRTKVGVLLAGFIQRDFPLVWPNAFDDLQNPQLLQGVPDIFLRALVALMDDFGRDETEINTRIKDVVRGYCPEKQLLQISPTQSISGQLLKTTVTLLAQALESINGNHNPSQEQLQICVLSLTVLKGFMSWLDLSLLLEEQVLSLIFTALAKGSITNSPTADAGAIAVECLQELIVRGMEDEKKIAMLLHTNVLGQIHASVNLEIVDASPIDVVLEVAKFIDRTGLEILPLMNGQETTVRSQLLDLFCRCFAYDDIDVSGAVIPLACSLVSSSSSEQQQQQQLPDAMLSQLLTITYRQMRYPEDFQFDYEDEDEAEEEMYRTELRKLNLKFIRVAPEACLQFTCQTLSQLQLPLSTAPTPDVEAALRLVYHYCEGIRPPPGMKVVMRNETFRNLLVALHTSDITLHPHREVLTLYYETAVRYYPLLKERPELLQKVLESLSGPRGLQHEHPRVRSRCCYMLLRLVKSVGGSGNPKNSVLRPYVETAVSGIQGLLQNTNVQLRMEDTLNLFETIGLLLGKAGLEPAEQQQCLTQVMTPHVRSIERILEKKQLLAQEPEIQGEILSGSVAAIAFMSKGFRNPSPEVQMVLLETLNISVAVLEALPSDEQVRNKSYVLIQRLIQCLEVKVLPCMPRILYLLITHSTAEDILDLSQLLNQLCIKFKEHAVPAIDSALLPFLQKCHALSISSTTAAPTTPDGMAAPHERIEQLSIQKLTFAMLQFIVANGVTSVLISPTNASSLETVLQSMSDGAIHVEDASMKKTCLIFFKELLDQWVKQGDKENAPAFVVQGYVRFVCDVMIPGVLQSFCKETFRVEDANQWRCVVEFAGVLKILQQRLPDVYYQEVLVGKFTNTLGCPAQLVEAFRVASDRQAIETGIKNLIQQGRKK